MILNKIIPLFSTVLKSDLFENAFIYIFCLAFLATVPNIIRKVIS